MDGTSVRIGDPIERKSLLYRSEVEYADWCANLFQGCAHDCRYCYARSFAKRTGRIANDDEWQVVRPVSNVSELLGAELPKHGSDITMVQMCFTTDPFVYDAGAGGCHALAEEYSLPAIASINEAGVPVSTLTKGVYPDALDVEALHPENNYGITVVSVNEEFREEWEPGAAPHTKRIESLHRLSDAGAVTWVSIEPYPTPNIDPSAGDASEILEAAPFVDMVIFGKMNYVPAATEYAKANPAFYETAALKVVEWCRVNGKGLLIKTGTPHAGNYTMAA